MIDLHPSPTAGTGRPQPVNASIHPKETKESIINCPHCGFPNDNVTGTNPGPLGDSNKIVAVSVSIPSGTKTYYEKQRTAGCKFCGLNFRKSSYGEPFFSSVNLQGR